YMLGASVSRLTSGFRTDLRYLARPFLESLSRETGETVCLNCARGTSRIVVDVIPASHEFSIIPAVGSALPIHIGASGKALMAFFRPEDVERILAECQQHPDSNEYGVSDVNDFNKGLRYARRHGFAWSIGDVFPGSAAVAAPVFDHTGNVAGSLTVRGPHVRLTRQRLIELAPTVKKSAASLSAALGYQSIPTRALG
ncbi:MAG: IclR family transcriptional regulator, partial [Lysobacterales bacterium]